MKYETTVTELEASLRTKPWVWVTDKGKWVRPKHMASEHIFNAVIMLFNHSVSPRFQVNPGHRRYSNVAKWPAAYKAFAVRKLLRELKTREIEPGHAAQLEDMAQ
ncbi:MAG: hypothetical protein ABI162_06795 [Luteolibacter sp.]